MADPTLGAGPRPRRSKRAAFFNDPATHAVAALGITQIVSWGTTLYALAVISNPIMADTGWSGTVVFGGLTVGLLVASLTSRPIGRLIDRHGGRLVMTLGSTLMALGLFWMAAIDSTAGYLAAWGFLGLAMRMTLYDAAFAALVQVTPTRGRRAISYLTLFGGFASTIFWPIGHWLVHAYGWRETLLIYAVLNLFICLPAHWWGLRRRELAQPDDFLPTTDKHDAAAQTQSAQAASSNATANSASTEIYLTGRDKTVGIWLFGTAISFSGFIFGALAVHMVNIIGAAGIAATTAVFIASFRGVAQVAGRLAEIVFAKNMQPLSVGRFAIALFPLSFAILMFGGASLLTALTFTILVGVSNGLVTIMRGAVPLELFGVKGYGEVLGILATPYWIMNALAPAVLALAIDAWGYIAAEAILLGAGVIAWLAIEIMSAWIKRRRGQDAQTIKIPRQQ